MARVLFRRGVRQRSETNCRRNASKRVFSLRMARLAYCLCRITSPLSRLVDKERILVYTVPPTCADGGVQVDGCTPIVIVLSGSRCGWAEIQDIVVWYGCLTAGLFAVGSRRTVEVALIAARDVLGDFAGWPIPIVDGFYMMDVAGPRWLRIFRTLTIMIQVREDFPLFCFDMTSVERGYCVAIWDNGLEVFAAYII
ncbi:hypothetical protein BDZ89DRAFT_251337 [Hymenopellis radicata]|nr:hypothetical protein BDZ89DRAFT_251337 [Hymenopellis radicata]